MIKKYSFTLTTLLISLILMTFLAIPVSAAENLDATPAIQTAKTAEIVLVNTVSVQTDVAGALDADEIASPDAENPDSDAVGVQEETPIAKKSSNAPFLTGAVIALLVFIGVAVFCKVKGNK